MTKGGRGVSQICGISKIAEEIQGMKNNIGAPEARKKKSQSYDDTRPPHATESEMRMTHVWS